MAGGSEWGGIERKLVETRQYLGREQAPVIHSFCLGSAYGGGEEI